MGEDESGPVRGCGERSFQPVGALVVEAAVVVVGLRGVDPDEAYGVVVDHVAAVSLGEVTRVAGQQVGEGLPEVGAVVMIARERQQGSGERLDDLTEAGVLLGRAVVGQVAGGEHHVGWRVEPVEVLDHGSQRGRRVDQRGEGPLVVATDVAVGDLGDEHGISVGRFPIRVSTWRSPRPTRNLERVKGIEPSSSAWKAEVLAVELHPRRRRSYRSGFGDDRLASGRWEPRDRRGCTSSTGRARN